MSFGTYARKVRDPTLPFAKRATSLRSAVTLYQPLGWRNTLRFLDQTAGRHSVGERQLLRALDLLEESRRHWLAVVSAYTRDRQAAKARGDRSPRASDPNPWRHPTGWYGPLRPTASLYALGVRRKRLVRSDPLERETETLAAACLAAGGGLTSAEQAALAGLTAEIGRSIRVAAARRDSRGEFRGWMLLHVIDLVAGAASRADHGPAGNWGGNVPLGG